MAYARYQDNIIEETKGITEEPVTIPVTVSAEGDLIKSEWFKLYTQPEERFKQMYITCDTAFSTKTSADNSVFLLAGITQENRIQLLDMYSGAKEKA